MNDENILTAEIFVFGKVQGVFFRQFTKNISIKLGLNGYVCNLTDGRVKVVVQGVRSSIESLIDCLKIGPPSSKVDNVSITWLQYADQFDTFTIKR